MGTRRMTWPGLLNLAQSCANHAWMEPHRSASLLHLMASAIWAGATRDIAMTRDGLTMSASSHGPGGNYGPACGRGDGSLPRSLIPIMLSTATDAHTTASRRSHLTRRRSATGLSGIRVLLGCRTIATKPLWVRCCASGQRHRARPSVYPEDNI